MQRSQGLLRLRLHGPRPHLVAVGRARSLDLAPITGLTVLVLALWLLTVAVARLVGWHGPAQGALLLATRFANAGNVGRASAS